MCSGSHSRRNRTRAGLQVLWLQSPPLGMLLYLPCPALSYAQCSLGELRKERVPISPGCLDARLSVLGDGFNVGSVW